MMTVDGNWQTMYVVKKTSVMIEYRMPTARWSSLDMLYGLSALFFDPLSGRLTQQWQQHPSSYGP